MDTGQIPRKPRTFQQSYFEHILLSTHSITSPSCDADSHLDIHSLSQRGIEAWPSSSVPARPNLKSKHEIDQK